ncbi:MAG: DUF896 domain-containing protein [Clostridia bacterium]|nr:DUF896 domain-containing protein [Clostridia bacterium]
MEQKKIDRISELTRISRTRELTAEEQKERQALREEYLQAIRGNMRQLLDNTVVERPDGSVSSLKKQAKKYH